MTEPNAFILYLEENRDDRAMMAALRRGLGREPGTVPEVSRIVQRRLASNAPSFLEDAYHLIAPLFALHSAEGGRGNMGDHFRAMCEPGQDPPPNVERRFMGLLARDSTDLADALRQAVSLLKSKGVPVDWDQLLRDVLAWSHPDRYVQKYWARAFWRNAQPARSADSNSQDN